MKVNIPNLIILTFLCISTAYHDNNISHLQMSKGYLHILQPTRHEKGFHSCSVLHPHWLTCGWTQTSCGKGIQPGHQQLVIHTYLMDN